MCPAAQGCQGDLWVEVPSDGYEEERKLWEPLCWESVISTLHGCSTGLATVELLGICDRGATTVILPRARPKLQGMCNRKLLGHEELPAL